jgi:hypothetical protein
MGANVNSIVTVTVDDVALEGELIVPDGATGLVLFAHRSGSSRHSLRNNFVAERVRARGVGTLLFDLLTEAEDLTYETRFDIPLLTDRLVGATRWVHGREDTPDLKIGYFGSSTRSAAALRAAAASIWRKTSSIACRQRRYSSPVETITPSSSGTRKRSNCWRGKVA